MKAARIPIPAPGHYYLNRDLAILKGEVWKDIRDFEGLYKISNFGRVKSLPRYREITIPKRGTICYWTKELILKQSRLQFRNAYIRDTTYCLCIKLVRDGQSFQCMVSRLVYAHFGPGKPVLSDKVLILHKDGDGLHNHISNLKAASHTEMHKISYHKKRKESHFKRLSKTIRSRYTRKAIEANKKPVTQYNLNGKMIRRYNSIMEAAKSTGMNDTSICNAVKGRLLTAGGFIWRSGKSLPLINTRRIQKRFDGLHKRKCKPVRQYSKAGKKIAEFGSLKEAAAAVSGSARQISDAVNGRSKTAYKYVWKFF